jgi:hypothetical protein
LREEMRTEIIDLQNRRARGNHGILCNPTG